MGEEIKSEQIEINLTADGIVSDTIFTAIQFLVLKSEDASFVEQTKYLDALNVLKIQGSESPGAPLWEEEEASGNPKMVSFGQYESFENKSPNLKTPIPSSSRSFAFDETTDEPDTTKL